VRHRVRAVIAGRESFTVAEVVTALPDLPKKVVKAAVYRLGNDKKITKQQGGRGHTAIWSASTLFAKPAARPGRGGTKASAILEFAKTHGKEFLAPQVALALKLPLNLVSATTINLAKRGKLKLMRQTRDGNGVRRNHFRAIE
jgi:hypothetical protein